MKTLILTGKFGQGHWSAAQALAERLGTAEVVDLMEWCCPGYARHIYRGFSLLVTHGRGLFNAYYRMTGRAKPKDSSVPALLLQERLGQLLAQEKPDLIVATHPLCAQAVACYRQKSGSAVPLLTCITDISVHPEWIHHGTDAYLVGSEDIRRGLAEKGVPREKIIVTGIPVRAPFHAALPRPEGGTRELLIMGGGLGMLPKKDAFYLALGALPGVHVTIITGRNEKLYQYLSGRYPNITVVGYTDRVWEYMSRADLMMSKPGGITLFEAISTGVPLLMPRPLLQQEINNAAFAVRRGVGVLGCDPRDARQSAAEIGRLLSDGAALERMRENMARLRGALEGEQLERLLGRLCAPEEACA